MSAYSFLNSFSNGFMFGMLTGGYGMGYFSPGFGSGWFSSPSLFMTPTIPMYNLSNPIFDFSQQSFNNYQNSYNSYNNLQNLYNWDMPSFQFNMTPIGSTQYTFNLSTNNNNSDYAANPTSYIGSDTKVTELYTGSVDALNKKLANRGVLRGKGAKFMEMQEKYGISASFLAAVCIQESGGTSKQATDERNLHNVAGITCNGGNDWKKYNSVDECIEDLARLIKNEYVNKGLVTIDQIHQKYCPPVGDTKDIHNINKGWGAGVSGIKQDIDKAIA